MSDYITTAQAAKLLNVTARTIRRKVAKLSKDTSAKYVRKDGKGILISKSFVLSNFKQATPPTEPKESPTEGKTTAKVVELLERQLRAKDDQIKALTDALRESQERQKESNYLLGKEQKERQALAAQLDELKTIGQRTDSGHSTEPENTTPPTNRPSRTDGIYFILLGLLSLSIIAYIVLILTGFL